MSDKSPSGLADPSRVAALLDRYRVTDGRHFRLADHRTGDTGPDDLDEALAGALLKQGIKRLAKLQQRLYADGRRSLLVILQAMDAAGKDSTIKHVMTGVNPQGVAVTSFKAPGPEELAHGFLWRSQRAVPARGMIAIFNRSHYEEVLIVRVHPDLVRAQHLPAGLAGGEHFWDHRLDDIAAFERYLVRQGTMVVKLFLNVGLEEQRKRLLARLEDPDKLWKFDPNDLEERRSWDAYMAAYEEAITATASREAPWFVVPADRKWLSRLVAVSAINEALGGLDLSAPDPSPDVVSRLAEARALLGKEP